MTLIFSLGLTGPQQRIDDRPPEVRVVFKCGWPPLEELRIDLRHHLIVLNLFASQLTALA
jgi:hypothetical protein